MSAAVDWALANVSTAKPAESRANVDPADPLLGDSEPTEALERLRLANAKLSELKYERETKVLVPAAELEDVLMQAMGQIRKAGDNLGRRFGPEAQLMLNEALDSAGELVERIGGDKHSAA